MRILLLKRYELPRDVAIKDMDAQGQLYKAELIKDIEDDTVSFYKQGNLQTSAAAPISIARAR